MSSVISSSSKAYDRNSIIMMSELLLFALVDTPLSPFSQLPRRFPYKDLYLSYSMLEMFPDVIYHH